MSGSAIFDLAIGIVFVFLLMSLISTQVGDKISTWLRWRSKDLESGIRKFVMEGDQGLGNAFMGNALFKSLVPEDTTITRWLIKSPLGGWVYQNQVPTKLAAKTFVQVLFNAVVPNAAGATSIDDLVKAVQGIKNDAVREKLLPLVTKADSSIDNARRNIENWYDITMEKTTEIYRRNMWGLSLVIALLVTFFLNVDTIAIGTNLWHNSTLRSAVASTAQDFVKNNQDAQAYAVLQKLDLPIGWHITTTPFTLTPTDWTRIPPKDYGLSIMSKLIGWLITMIAAAQGAPFWFDLLKKMTQR
jgi:hypothetical protein